MSNLGNKQIMAENIRYYIEKNKLNVKEFSTILNFKYTTVLDWVNAKTYPRIDKIEIMANYFNIEKSDLVEKRTSNPTPNNQTDEKQDTDISEQLEQMMAKLAEQKNALMFRGELMDDETKEAVLMAMQQAAKIAELSLKSNSQKDKE